jgi:hypothetical protein
MRSSLEPASLERPRAPGKAIGRIDALIQPA